MKKKIAALFFTLLLCIGMALPIFAADQYLVDDANLLTEEERTTIEAALSATSDKYDMDVAILTTESMNGEDPDAYMDAYYEANYGRGEKKNGMILVIDMGGRQVHFSACEDAIQYFCDDAKQEITDSVSSYLSEGRYADGCKEYINKVIYMIDYKNENGYAYKSYEDPNYYNTDGSEKSEQKSIMVPIIVAMIVGVIAAFSISGKMKASMKSVRPKASARDYFNPDELKLSGKRDTFLYTTVSKVRISSDDKKGGGGGFSSHTSSGGFSHSSSHSSF